MDLQNSNKAWTVVKKQGIIFALIIIVLIFSFAAKEFFTADNIILILRQISIVGIMACGMTYVIIGGGNFDLSVGSLLSLTCVLAISLHDTLGPVPAMLIAVAAGLASGIVSGWLVGYLRLNSMIVTLGMMGILQAVVLIYSGGKYSSLSNPDATWFSMLGKGSLGGIPVPIIIYAGCIIIFEIVLKKTVFGRQLMAVGGNSTACRFTGINDKKIVMMTFVLSGLMTAVAGVILGARVGAAQSTIGEGYEFDVITGVILGGTSLLGGSGSVAKTFIGVLIMGVLKNGFVMIEFPYYTQWIAQWVIIILVVWIDIATKRKKVLV